MGGGPLHSVVIPWLFSIEWSMTTFDVLFQQVPKDPKVIKERKVKRQL